MILNEFYKWSMSVTIYIAILIAFFSSVLTPLIFVLIRESVKRQRQEIIRDLETVFHLPEAAGQNSIVPSFEFVKYKYFLKRADGGTNDRDDFRLFHWVVSSIPLILICFSANFLVVTFFSHYILGETPAYATHIFDAGKPEKLYFWVTLASYAGGYIFMIRAFYRAINNFDLSPLSFVGACLNLTTGIIVSLVVVYGLMYLAQSAAPTIIGEGATPGNTSPVNSFSFGAILLASFAVGYMPELATRNLLWSSRVRNYKKENIAVYRSFSAMPVEVIDGIDTEIRDRLADFHINAVQNLAAANPLMLFVETPYGVYQIMDWVAQAQLCCSVGPVALVKLWGLGIRTIFDLERAALDPECRNADLLNAIGGIIITTPGITEKKLSEAMIIADIRLRLEHPHVQRLRQIFIRVRDRLGDDSQRLPPLADCPFIQDPKCPFAKPHVANAA